jgi:hypothetical protein
MLLKWDHYLHPMVEFEVGCAYQTINAYSNLDIFEQIPSTNELTIKFVKKGNVDFQTLPS